MEIDLELPSVREDKLDTGSGPKIGGGVDVLCVGEEVVNSTRTRNDDKGLGLNADVNFSRRGEGVDEDANGLETFGKESKSYEPQKGMEFESKEEAYSFYREYARSVGFGITIKASRRSKKSGKFIDVKIACSKFGSKPDSTTAVNSRSRPKTDCKANMHMKRRQDGKWFIFSFVKEHNHEICPSDFYYALSGRGKQSGIVTCQKKGLQLALDEVDVQVMLEFFMLMQDENPNFFYAIDLDHEKHMRNMFWVDAKSRHDYSKFCDVVFFNGYYVRNKYRVPFMPIIGVNHHFQLILLGCALVGEETTSTFVWLMRTWLRAVGRQTPKVIITDEGKILEEAVAEVFPDTRHCFCLWNVLRKIPENLGHVVNQPEIFLKKFNKCIYRSWTQEEFEKKWWQLMDKFELREDKWLQSLYGNRKKWVPAYMLGTFLAGLCASERSECTSSLFDKYLHRETSCKEFTDQYKVFLHDRSEEEARADFETHDNSPALRSVSPFGKQMSTVYTRSIFKKFQVELLGTADCRAEKTFEDEAVVTYQVDDFEEQQSFIVEWNEADLHVSCLCRSFEYKGFLCRHALIVLQIAGVSNIPSHFILRRWTNDVNIRLSSSEISSRFGYRVKRFNDLCKRAIKLGEQGSLSQETYKIVIDALQEAMEQCVGVNTSVRCVLEPNMPTAQGLLSTEEENKSDSLAKASRKKKIHKKQKVQSETEVVTDLVQDCNLQMGQLDSGAHFVVNTYAQQDMPGMGQLHSLSSVRNGYYTNQQGMKEMGQSNSIAMRLGHYGPQESLQRLGPLGFRAPTIHGCFNIQDSLHSAGSRHFHDVVSKRLHGKHIPR